MTESTQSISATQGRNLLVLCYGNIYRSPFVATKLSGMLAAQGWAIKSAGFHEKAGRACSDSHIAMAQGYGVDLSEHRSVRIDQVLADWADLIVIMDGHNRDQLRAFADTDRKVVWVGAFVEDARPDIDDPYGRPEKRVRLIVDELDRASVALAAELRCG